VKQLYEFGGDGDLVLGDHRVRAKTAASRYSEIQSRLDQTLIVAILQPRPHRHDRFITSQKFPV